MYCPFVGIYFMTYEQAKRVFQKTRGYASVDDLPLPYQLGTYRPVRSPSQCVVCVAKPCVCVNTVGAASAGAIAAAVTSPLDIIKTRIQVGSDYKGAVDAARRIWTEEGPRAFTKVPGRLTSNFER